MIQLLCKYTLIRSQQVTIDFLRNLPSARTVNVEPASADDWEVVVRWGGTTSKQA